MSQLPGQRNADSLTTVTRIYDFSVLDAYVADKRIVALGECTHGIGDFYTFKSELVKYLHQQHGYQVLAMEGGFGTINWMWAQAAQISTHELLTTLYQNFQCAEILPLFTYLKAQDDLAFTGFDSQTLSLSIVNTLADGLNHIDTTHIKYLRAAIASYQQVYGQQALELAEVRFNYHRDRCIMSLERIKQIFIQDDLAIKKSLKCTEWQWKVLLYTLDILQESINFSYAERYTTDVTYYGYLRRDQLMYEAMEWLIRHKYSDQKIILWGHNAHIEKDCIARRTVKNLGHYLKEAFGEHYYALGLFAYQGEAYNGKTKQIEIFKNDHPLAIEYLLRDFSTAWVFQDLATDCYKELSLMNWCNNEVTGREIENGGIISFIPAKRFDGVINFYQVEAPKPLD